MKYKFSRKQVYDKYDKLDYYENEDMWRDLLATKPQRKEWKTCDNCGRVLKTKSVGDKTPFWADLCNECRHPTPSPVDRVSEKTPPTVPEKITVNEMIVPMALGSAINSLIDWANKVNEVIKSKL
jgi:hypothetical protein